MTHLSPYTQIRRGPMGGDHYTQIHNWVFRDRTLTPNAKAIFGWISTHTQGWGTSIDDIATNMVLGRDATRAALALLKERHYLVYGRERGPKGTLGGGWYFLTDLPAQLGELGITDDVMVADKVADAVERWKEENSTSSPGWGIQYPGGDGEFPQVGTRMAKTSNLVEPHVAVRPPKKTNEPQEEQSQEDKIKNQDREPKTTSKDPHSAIAPPTRSVSGDQITSQDPKFVPETEDQISLDQQKPSTPTVETGVKNTTLQSPPHGSTDVATGSAVGTQMSASPDDLDAVWGGVERDEHGTPRSPAQRERAFYTQFPECLDFAREERLEERVLGLVGLIEPYEEHAMRAMLDRGEHPNKVANTILKQRVSGYSYAT